MVASKPPSPERLLPNMRTIAQGREATQPESFRPPSGQFRQSLAFSPVPRSDLSASIELTADRQRLLVYLQAQNVEILIRCECGRTCAQPGPECCHCRSVNTRRLCKCCGDPSRGCLGRAAAAGLLGLQREDIRHISFAAARNQPDGESDIPARIEALRRALSLIVAGPIWIDQLQQFCSLETGR